jgi:hypothetical protein
MNKLQDNFLQDRVEAFMAGYVSEGQTSLSPEAITFLNSPNANTFSTFIGGNNSTTGENKIVYSDNPTIKFGDTPDLVVVTGVSGNLITVSRNSIDSRTTFPNDAVTAATSSNTPNTIIRRDAAGSVSVATLNSSAILTTTVNASNSITTVAMSISGPSTYLNGATFVYQGSSAASHRTALGLDSNVVSNPSGIAGATAITNIVRISQAAYNALTPTQINAQTVYLIA